MCCIWFGSICLADSRAGGADRADEGDSCRGDQREGKSLAI
jgi:hypothetical protein